MPRVRLRNDVGSGFSGVFHRFLGEESCTKYHAHVFVHTFLSYAFLHATRKTLSTVKPSLVYLWTHNSTTSAAIFPTEQAATEFLGALDTGFMIAYALGLFVSGVLGDRYNPTIILSVGMMMSSLTVFAFGYLTETFKVYSAPIYAFLWILNGLIQSTAWPTEVSIMGNWFGHSTRGTVMGIWSSCASVGNIIGTIVASHSVEYGYQYAFALNCAILFIYSFVVVIFLPAAPRSLGLPEIEDDFEEIIETERPPPLGFFRAWLLPGVLAYSLAYACLKLVNYGFFFWLPYYLHTALHWPESYADSLSTWYDVGGIIAAIVAGAISDRMSSRTPIVFGMLMCSTVALYIYAHSPSSYAWNAFLLIVAGFFIGGPANMISSSVTADLGKCREVRGSAEALSTVTGIIDGTGSSGAAIGQWFIPSIQLWFGWGAVFYGFILMMFCTALCISPLLWKEHQITSVSDNRGSSHLVLLKHSFFETIHTSRARQEKLPFLVWRSDEMTADVRTISEGSSAPAKGLDSFILKRDDEDFRKICDVLEKSFADKELYKVLNVLSIKRYKNKYLEWKFDNFKKVVRSSGQNDVEHWAFREILSDKEESFIAQNGVLVGSTFAGTLGDSNKGVLLYTNPDLTTASSYYRSLPITLMIFKTVRGRSLLVDVAKSSKYDLTPQLENFSHMPVGRERMYSRETPRRMAHQLSAVYHYEHTLDGEIEYVPAGVLPYAFVELEVKDWKLMNLVGRPPPALSSIYYDFALKPMLKFDLMIPGYSIKEADLCSVFGPGFPLNGFCANTVRLVDGPFFDASKFAEIRGIAELQNKSFGDLAYLPEIFIKDRQVFAAYSVFKSSNPVFTELIADLYSNNAFLMLADPTSTTHLVLPSGQLSSSLGLPASREILHVVSLSSMSHFAGSFSLEHLTAYEDRQTMESRRLVANEELICVSMEFITCHSRNAAEHADAVEEHSRVKNEEPTISAPVEVKKLAPIALPLASSQRFRNLKPPLAPGAVRPKHTRRVNWHPETVLNQKRETSVDREKRKREEKLVAAEVTPEEAQECNAVFKSAFHSSGSGKIAPPKVTSTLATIPNNGQEAVSRENAAPTTTYVKFSEIASLPLPPTANREQRHAEILAGIFYQEEDVAMDIDTEDSEEVLAGEKNELAKKPVIGEEDQPQEIPTENPAVAAEEEKIEEEDGDDLLSFCLSSSRPAPPVVVDPVKNASFPLVKEDPPKTVVPTLPTNLVAVPGVSEILKNISGSQIKSLTESISAVRRNRFDVGGTAPPAVVPPPGQVGSKDVDLRLLPKAAIVVPPMPIAFSVAKMAPVKKIEPVRSVIFNQEEEEEEEVGNKSGVKKDRDYRRERTAPVPKEDNGKNKKPVKLDVADIPMPPPVRQIKTQRLHNTLQTVWKAKGFSIPPNVAPSLSQASTSFIVSDSPASPEKQPVPEVEEIAELEEPDDLILTSSSMVEKRIPTEGSSDWEARVQVEPTSKRPPSVELPSTSAIVQTIIPTAAIDEEEEGEIISDDEDPQIIKEVAPVSATTSSEEPNPMANGAVGPLMDKDDRQLPPGLVIAQAKELNRMGSQLPPPPARTFGAFSSMVPSSVHRPYASAPPPRPVNGVPPVPGYPAPAHTGFGAYAPVNPQAFAARQPTALRGINIVADNLLFNPAVMDVSKLEALFRKMEALKAGTRRQISLLLHANLQESLKKSADAVRRGYAAVLENPKNKEFVRLLPKHDCDFGDKRATNMVMCLSVLVRTNRNAPIDIIYLSNMSSAAQTGAQITGLGVKMMRLNDFLQS
ncbi:unnamed protein product [Caenorhabditis auriculariae]|uniref:Major facilitator superfamily (MFS) profile domain-containing protein n=1 Tax=Caenorhabditis auriculariae TaxID=2777116 RepID=A0A8S1HCV7_9PELO|nr:unnamed protein product [Caenorhabditis auriculariae]